MSINPSNNRPKLGRSLSLVNALNKEPILNRSSSFASSRMKDIQKKTDMSLETQMRRMHSQKNINPKISSAPEASGDFVQVGKNMIEVHKLGRGNAKPKEHNNTLEKKENKRFRSLESIIEQRSKNVENISIKNEKKTHVIVTQNISRDLEEGEISPEENMHLKKRKMIQEGKQEAIRQDSSEELEEGEISPEEDMRFKKRKMIQEGKQEVIKRDVSEELEEGEINPEKEILEKLKIIHSMSGEQKDAIFDVLGATGLFPKDDIKITKEFLNDTSEMPKQYIHNDGVLDVKGYYKRKTALKD